MKVLNMTAQAHDHVVFNKEYFSIVGVAGGPLVTPEQFGMKGESWSTDLYRGFYANYELTKSGLFLNELRIIMMERKYLPIDGVLPEKATGDNEFAYPTYRNLKVPVPFTGQIRLARDFIGECYVHMGFQSPTAFRTVYDLTLENGRMVKLKDRSKDMEKKRNRGVLGRTFRSLLRIIKRENSISKSFTLDMDKE